MSAYEKEWARRQRAALMEILGPRCNYCGDTEPKTLEFDCVKPMGDKHHRMDTSARMSFYRRQFREGNLQVLCRYCNNTKGNYSEEQIKEQEFEETQPF